MRCSGSAMPSTCTQFHVTVPAGVDSIEVSLDAITSQDSAGGGGPAASSNVLDLNWNPVVLYPKGARSDDVQFAAFGDAARRMEIWNGVAGCT